MISLQWWLRSKEMESSWCPKYGSRCSSHSCTTSTIAWFKRSKMIHTRVSLKDMKHLTLAATVAASWKMLTLFLIFKGNGNCNLQCQEKAWINKSKMNEWIDVILGPWREYQNANHPLIWPPIIILNAYHVLQVDSVFNCTQSIGIEAIHIPACWTYLCQPMILGLANPSIVNNVKRVRNGWWQGVGLLMGWKKNYLIIVVEWLVEVNKKVSDDLRGCRCHLELHPFYFN